MARPKPNEVLQRFERLPRDLRAAIFSVDTADAIQEIAKKNRLTTEVMGKLADETGYFMLGFTKPEHFIENLQKRLGVDFEIARQITEDLNIQIFAKVRESLKRAHMLEENPVVPIPKQPPSMNMPLAPAPVQSAPQFSAQKGPLGEVGPFESQLQEKIFSAQKELSEARTQKTYPGNRDPYHEPLS